MIKLNKKIGQDTLQIEFAKMTDMHKFNSIYGSLPSKCTSCDSPQIYLSHKSPGGNDYYTLACGACGAEANFGMHKDNKGLYWKAEKMTVYQGNGKPKDYKSAIKDDQVPIDADMITNDEETVPF